MQLHAPAIKGKWNAEKIFKKPLNTLFMHNFDRLLARPGMLIGGTPEIVRGHLRENIRSFIGLVFISGIFMDSLQSFVSKHALPLPGGAVCFGKRLHCYHLRLDPVNKGTFERSACGRPVTASIVTCASCLSHRYRY
jgi:hypothetical protein